MADFKPIKTIYNGYRFRSRLEARWAVFFDTLGIKYEYEPEGYSLSNGEKYLPDFYLPGLGYYAEVKGYSDHIASDINKTINFVKDKKCALILLTEIPYDKDSNGLYWLPIFYFVAKGEDKINAERAFFAFGMEEAYIEDDFYEGINSPIYIHKNLDLEPSKIYEKLKAVPGRSPYNREHHKEFSVYDCAKDGIWGKKEIQEALLTARQARFEHGEHPITERSF